jgi:uncharacterized membrane-anchored protein YitT (DUF2179 family)
MDDLIDFFIELAKNWRILISAIACCIMGLALSRLMPDLIVHLSLGGFFLGLAIGLMWQSKQSNFNF